MDETRTLVVDLAGRLREDDRLLPEEPATLDRRGTVPDHICMNGIAFVALGPGVPRADCHWRETLMEAHERQAEMR